MSTPVLSIFNTFSRTKERFQPADPKAVRFYVCGVTIYDHCHVGHARAYVAFDVIRRTLLHRGFGVKFVQNFTDIDDKIIRRAAEAGESISDLTRRFEDSFFADMDALGILRADLYPKATQHIAEMITLITTLIQNGAAYAVDGDVYFKVDAFPNYGNLSKKVLKDLIAGARVDVSEKKQSPLDFALWKSAKTGEPAWESPWGMGRPGWHIECSAMAMKALGPQIDIHAGGEDLIFPHHENEIAQSEAATHLPFSKYWIHNGFVTMKDEKMSKSSGNFVTIRQILDRFSGETLRFFLLRSHYRAPLSFSYDAMTEAKTAYTRLQNAARLPATTPDSSAIPEFVTRFDSAMSDDFNYAEAIGVLFDLAHHAQKTGEGVTTLNTLGQVLGLFHEAATQINALPTEVTAFIAARADARKSKDFAKSDTLRDAILALGYTIEDTPDGVRCKKV